ncbi:hypothetical protein SRHO_G00255760 [Serrasalmus rhombeus]
MCVDEVVDGIPREKRLVIGADFNGHVGEGNRGDEEVLGMYGVKDRNAEGQMVVDFAKRMEMAVVNTYFQKREEHRVTYKSGGSEELPEDWETTAKVVREIGKNVLGVSSGQRKEDKESWWWNEEVQESIQKKKAAKKKLDNQRDEGSRQEYCEASRIAKIMVAKAKAQAYDELYERLDSKGVKDLYRMAKQRDRAGKDVQQVRLIKDREGNVLVSEQRVLSTWKEYFEELMNEENKRERRTTGGEIVDQEVQRISKVEVRAALKRMKNGKAVGPDDIPVEVWRCLGEKAVDFLTRLFNKILESERMPDEWRSSVLVPIFKNKGDVQSCSN